MKEPDIKIGISTVADTAGIDAAQKKITALKNTAEEAQNASPAGSVPGNGTAPAQARQEAEASRLLQQQMRLETQTRRELLQEIRRLNIARKAAAKAGNAEQYANLSKQYGAARQSLEQLNQSSAISTMAMTNQAQTGMLLANSAVVDANHCNSICFA